MKIKMKRMMVSLLLVLSMLVSMISTGSYAQAANPVSDKLTLSYLKGDPATTQSFVFTASTETGEVKHTDGTGTFYKVTATINGSDVKEVVLGLDDTDRTKFTIWGKGGSFYDCNNNGNTVYPTTSFEIAKDAVFTEMYHNGSKFIEVANGHKYQLGEKFSVTKENGIWKEEQETLTLSYKEGDPATNQKFVFTASTATGGVKHTNNTGTFYKVTATINGSDVKEVVLGLDDTDCTKFTIWGKGGSFYDCNNNGNTVYPTTSFEIAKDAVFTEMYHNGSKFIEVANGHKYQLGEKFSLIKENGIWKEPQEKLETLTLSYKEGDPATISSFHFTASTATGEVKHTNDKGTYYKVTATINGSDVKEVVLGLDDTDRTKFTIWGKGGSFYDCNNNGNTVYPTTSFEIAKDAVFTEMYHNGSKFMEVANGHKYQLGEKFSIVKEGDIWKNSSEQSAKPTTAKTMISYDYVDANSNFRFKWAIDGGAEGKEGWYTAEIEVDGAPRKVIIQGQKTGFWIYYHCFTCPPNGVNPKIPTASVKIPAGIVFTPVIQNQWETVNADGTYYEVKDTLHIEYKYERWDNADAFVEPPTPPTESELTLDFSKFKSWGLYLNGTVTGEGSLIKDKYYKVEATVDGTTKDIVISVVEEEHGNIAIWSNFFGWTPGSANAIKPTTSFKIAKDAIFTEVDPNGWSKVPYADSFKLSKELSLLNGDTGWYDESRPPVKMTANVSFNRADEKLNFCFDWTIDGGADGKEGWYTAEIEVDGAPRKVIIQGKKTGFWIYYHCFTCPPNGENPTPPTTSVKIPAGTVFTPVEQNKWAEAISDGTYYTVKETLQLESRDGIWMNAGVELEEPLEVKVSFNKVYRGALYLKAELADGRDISEIYGKDWPMTTGNAIRGIADDNNQFTYTKTASQGHVVEGGLYLGNLYLNQLDEVKIEAGTIFYMAPTSAVQRPIKIVNSFRMARNAEDEWESDNIAGSNSQGTSPKTGDNIMFMPWIVMMSCAGLSLIIWGTKKHREPNKE